MLQKLTKLSEKISIFILLMLPSQLVFADDPYSPLTNAGNWVISYVLKIALPFLTLALMYQIAMVKQGHKSLMDVAKFMGYAAAFAAAPAIMGAIWTIAHG